MGARVQARLCGAFCSLVLTTQSPFVQDRVGDDLCELFQRSIPVGGLLVPWVCCHLFPWLRGLYCEVLVTEHHRPLLSPYAAGAEQMGVSGGRGFIFSPTSSVILSLWRYHAGAHEIPCFSCQ